MKLGEKLKIIIEKAISVGMISNKAAFAKLLGVNEATLYRLFTMDSLKTKYIKTICEITKISIEDFYRETDPSVLVQEPSGVYLTKNQMLAKELSDLNHELQLAKNMVASLQEQLKLKEEIIELMRVKESLIKSPK